MDKKELTICPENQFKFLLSLYFSNKILEALTLLEQLINDYTDDPDLFHIQGECFHKCYQLEQAKESYEKSLSINPNNAEGYNNLALINREIGEYDTAIDYLKKSLRLSPNYVEAYSNLGLVYKNIGDYRSAILNYKKAISIDSAFTE